MIYFDNAATSWPKPQVVVDKTIEAVKHAGNPGRGVHELAKWSSMKIYETREKIANLFNVNDALNVAFTLNATEALNAAINLVHGDIITTAMEHNSVLRPCETRKGLYRVIPADSKGNIDVNNIINKINSYTDAVVMTHASNVIGTIYDIRKVGLACREKGVLFIVDASQTAGIVPIDMKDMCIDILCFTGHKGLYGLQGTGGICVNSNIQLKPLKCGGTGSKSYDLNHPRNMPEVFEAGTLNTHGIASLGAGVDYINSIGIEKIYKHEKLLVEEFIKGLLKLDNVIIYGDLTSQRVGVVSLNIKDKDPSEICSILASQGICVRTGTHCAPLAHKSMGTQETGTIRFSFGVNNTIEEINTALGVLTKITKS